MKKGPRQLQPQKFRVCHYQPTPVLMLIIHFSSSLSLIMDSQYLRVM
ncbi:unnamed protein product [Rodentolepis nana]|uniref:Uncharacterized protein n=1 Tax=Rodentolepis nana TaxID=102285 RepID=A0A0R3TJ67_RODNA|nr:unnamed protein product [Rodentolepis nana]